MFFKAINQINPISAMKTFTKPNYNSCRGGAFNNPKKSTRQKRNSYKQGFGYI